MNLADAVREAALRSQVHHPGVGETTSPAQAISTLVPPPTKRFASTTLGELAGIASTAAITPQAQGVQPRTAGESNLANHSDHRSEGMVRLEFFLTPEQVQAFAKALSHAQSRVMTLREAAAFLRLPSSRLEVMAASEEIPGLLIDGRWRFSRARLEQWVEGRILEDHEDNGDA